MCFFCVYVYILFMHVCRGQRRKLGVFLHCPLLIPWRHHLSLYWKLAFLVMLAGQSAPGTHLFLLECYNYGHMHPRLAFMWCWGFEPGPSLHSKYSYPLSHQLPVLVTFLLFGIVSHCAALAGLELDL